MGKKLADTFERPDPCEGCGEENPQSVKFCPHCGRTKCSICDMGDDVECPSCTAEEE